MDIRDGEILPLDDDRAMLPVKIEWIGDGEFQSGNRCKISLCIPGIIFSGTDMKGEGNRVA